MARGGGEGEVAGELDVLLVRGQQAGQLSRRCHAGQVVVEEGTAAQESQRLDHDLGKERGVLWKGIRRDQTENCIWKG